MGADWRIKHRGSNSGCGGICWVGLQAMAVLQEGRPIYKQPGGYPRSYHERTNGRIGSAPGGPVSLGIAFTGFGNMSMPPDLEQ